MKEICGDIRLNFHRKIVYFLSNFIRGISGQVYIFKSIFWCPENPGDDNESPSRKYLNCFLYRELPNIIPVGEVEILDVGCGNGYFRYILANLGYTGFYTGMDVTANPHVISSEQLPFGIKFIQQDIETFHTERQYDLIISITSLEHIENDFVAISRISELLKPGGIQIHIIPSFWSLFLYLFHGYRQYTPRRIIRLFEGKQYIVFRLGGMFSFFLHILIFTIPSLYKGKAFNTWRAYRILVRMCNRIDRLIPLFPALYVVVSKNNGL